MESLGVWFDYDKNEALPRGTAGVISKDGSPVTVLVIPTDEELMIASDTAALARAL